MWIHCEEGVVGELVHIKTRREKIKSWWNHTPGLDSLLKGGPNGAEAWPSDGKMPSHGAMSIFTARAAGHSS